MVFADECRGWRRKKRDTVIFIGECGARCVMTWSAGEKTHVASGKRAQVPTLLATGGVAGH